MQLWRNKDMSGVQKKEYSNSKQATKDTTVVSAVNTKQTSKRKKGIQ